MPGRKKSDRHVYERIGRNLVNLRRERGITQVELAERSGIAQSIISRYERGEVRIYADQLLEIARVLRVETTDLLRPPSPIERPPRLSLRWWRRMTDIARLTKTDQKLLAGNIDAFLAGKTLRSGSGR